MPWEGVKPAWRHWLLSILADRGGRRKGAALCCVPGRREFVGRGLLQSFVYSIQPSPLAAIVGRAGQGLSYQI